MEDLYSAMAQIPALNVVSIAANILAAIFAGAVAAWLEPDRPYHRAALAGSLIAVFVAIQLLVPYEHAAPAWANAIALITPVPATLAGAFWWIRTRTH